MRKSRKTGGWSMAARAIWKGVIRFEDVQVPVKLYSAVVDRGIHFRLLHEPDLVPVEQRMVHPVTEKIVPAEATRLAFEAEENLVVLDDEELEALEPPPSRDIEILRFVPPGSVDHRLYVRPYWLGPDGSEPAYHALVRALVKDDRVGVGRWTMRNERYQGALRVREEHLMLITLRHAEEVISAAELEAPRGREFDERELTMAKQLIGALAGDFQPERYKDDYREHVLELVEAKASGRTIEIAPYVQRRPKRTLEQALAASLEAAGRRKSVA
jgi:DNA end-binding protein Ku